jgi:hypothetical protein
MSDSIPNGELISTLLPAPPSQQWLHKDDRKSEIDVKVSFWVLEIETYELD